MNLKKEFHTNTEALKFCRSKEKNLLEGGNLVKGFIRHP
jgi:hypothetical protein